MKTLQLSIIGGLLAILFISSMTHIFISNAYADSEFSNMTKVFDLAKANQTQIKVDCQFQYNCNYGFESLDWSPDGKFIIFTIDYSPTPHVWKVDLQTKQSEDLNIPMKTDSILYLRISPDENSIIFFADHVIDSNNNQIPDLFRFDIKEQKLIQITNGTEHDMVESAVWTPDGNIIYSKSHAEKLMDMSSPTNLWLVDRNGKIINKIYSEPSLFTIYDISKDGKKLLISNGRILDLDTMKIQNVKETFADSLYNSRFALNDELFIYSPGATYSPGGPIYIASTDGSYLQTIQMSNMTPFLPVLSPDGKYIAFSTDAKNTGEKPEYYGIYVAELANPVPEFPLAIPILLASITSLIVFYRMKFRK